MFKKLVLAAMCLPMMAFAQENKFTIQGTIENYNPGAKVFLAYSIPGRMVMDSCAIENGQFAFKGIVTGNKKAYLQMLHKDNGTRMPHEFTDVTGIFLENGIVKVSTKDSLKYATVSGTPFNDLNQQLRNTLSPFAKTEQQMEIDFAKAKAENNQQKQAEVQQAYLQMDEARKAIVNGFILGNKDSYVSFSALRTHVDPSADSDRAIFLFDSLDESLRTTNEGRIYNNALTEARKLSIGGEAPDFTLPNAEGEEISLSSLRGKYILLDFWASWCGPCRVENPNLVHAYNKFKDKNFTILGVSLDGGSQGKEKWIQAIQADNLAWEQVSDLNGWKSAAATLYQIRSIPANFLLDPSGKIVAKNLRGHDLETKLAEIL